MGVGGVPETPWVGRLSLGPEVADVSVQVTSHCQEIPARGSWHSAAEAHGGWGWGRSARLGVLKLFDFPFARTATVTLPFPCLHPPECLEHLQ